MALLVILVEQNLLKLFSVGKVFGKVHTCIGQEFTDIELRTFAALVGGGIDNNFDVLHGYSVYNQILDPLLDYGILGLLSLGWLW
jgi:hypothetical protein